MVPGDSSVDKLVEQLSSIDGLEELSAGVSENHNHPRLALYKNSRYALDQERRWRSELANCRRQDIRKSTFIKNRIPSIAVATSNPWSGRQNRKKFWKVKLRLMLAEWFLFMPEDFSSQYLFKFCPKGRHVYVVAAKGQTNVYSRTGNCLATLLTRLPGGGLGQSSSQMHRDETALDCIMLGVPSATMTHARKMETEGEPIDEDPTSSGSGLTFMVLDLVSFKSTSYESTRFYERCQWLEGFHREQILAHEPGDVARFDVVPAHSCDWETMNCVLSSPPPFELDGVLFYHRDVFYQPGTTPLVGWMKPYMLPEWFPSISVHSDYLVDMAPDYKDYLSDIGNYKEQTAIYSKVLTDAKAKGEKKGGPGTRATTDRKDDVVMVQEDAGHNTQ